MTESTRTKTVIAAWKRRHPSGDATKFNDGSTSGIPDAVFVDRGYTAWIEFKLPRNGEDWRLTVTAPQRLKLRLITRAGGRAYVGVYRPKGQLELWVPVGARDWLLVVQGAEAGVMDGWRA